MTTFTTESYEFTKDGGKVYAAGKAHWPAVLRLNLSRQQAFETAVDLLNRLKHDPEAQSVELVLFGAMQRNPEDDLEHTVYDPAQR